MTVSATNSFDTATGNGAATSFPFDFAIRSAAEVNVYVNGVLQSTGFSVVLNAGNNGGTVTFTTPPANGAAVLIASNPSFEQLISFLNSGNYNPSAVDGANDQAAIRDIWLLASVARGIKLPLGEGPAVDLPSQATRAGKYLMFDGSGQPTVGSQTGAQGSPGGNILSIGPFSALTGMTIPAGTTRIRTSCFSTTTNKGGAFYKLSSGLPAWGQGKWWQVDAQGNQWELAEPQPETDMFGTVGDGVAQSPSGAVITSSAALLATVTGTDVTQKIQDCVDYCLYKGIANVILSEGRHVISGPIQLGYGGTYSTINLIGRGVRWSAWDSQFGGSCLLVTHSNAPALVCQGVRQPIIRDLTVYGLFANWVLGNYLAYNSSTQSPPIDDTNIANWSSPGLNANQDTQYTPFAAIAVDPYAGAQPATAYPAVNYPAWTGITTQYNKLVSSQLTLQDVHIIGFIAGVAVQPCNADSNGDFPRMFRCEFDYCKYAVTVGNSQCRSVEVRDCTFNSCHTLFEGLTHGHQTGRFNGVIDNTSGSSCIQVFNVAAAYALPLAASNCYFEGCWRLGNITGSGAGSITFTACYFDFPMAVQNNTRGQPINHLSGSTTRHTGLSTCQAPIRFIGCKMGVESVLMLIAQDVSFDGEMRPNERASGTVALYQAYAHNGLAGGLVIWDFDDDPNYIVNVSSRYAQIDGTTGVVGSDTSMLNNRFTCTALARKFGVPIYAEWLKPATQGTAVQVRQKPTQYAKSSFSAPSLAGRVLTMTDTNGATSVSRTGRLPGDVLIDRETGTVFFITSYDPGTKLITAKMQNNFKGNAGSETPVQALALTTGEWEFMPTRLYTPDYPLIVDSTAASATLANAGTADGNTTSLTSGSPAVGDYIAINNYEDYMVSQDGTTISSMSTSPAQIVMTAAANVAQSRKRLLTFRATPPANVTAP